MIRHIAMIRFVDGVTEKDVSRVDTALGELPSRIPEIKRYAFGRDLGLSNTNADYTIVADFDSVDDFRTYVSHPDHVTLLSEVTGPLTRSVERIQYSIDR